MIDVADSVEEVYAVLAHEIGHVERRHSLRHIVQNSVTAAVAAAFTSDVSSLTLAVSGIPVLLAQAKYSREFETEADTFAFALLKKNDISPENFATLMERLSAKRNPRSEGSMAFLSTHPVTAERIARARAAAR
jgi:Zn-dependent protease with chaperone function